MFLAQVHVTYKPSILDPQAEAIKNAMHRLEFNQVTAVQQGKYFEITLDVPTVQQAEKQIDAICDQLLANPNMETYRYQVKELANQ
ncbi:phosphoribosylformylglycinamidine synthase subunit PurS [Lactobacillus sp. LC28-10]|uniref:Phosphoribosylformylglycinamidine synthase subunit PurS n=1 Tax=Secundilactobacillus angelensis TaxID=2722706 RepID=A0ABX1KZ32_9LACO|nr:phosphoribosylformylglycinamidine synthase subunit PurS [Secundilactobacillus angelensis]MCH5463259.1 phosphoribosylformylglycinamidine synthase subunit PurS [Secundilactobacillus angelensis]NLR19187.1 phosphoribosylformylglycinamidine synthase subunit PurS [Secundilactobacillus angelensis]